MSEAGAQVGTEAGEYATYHCPHCHKISYLPASFASLQGFPLICGHCESAFTDEAHPPPITPKAPKAPIAGNNKEDVPHILSCPSCPAEMSVLDDEYDILLGQLLYCPQCHSALTLPTKPSAAPIIRHLAIKITLLYLLILASLALLFTPQGEAFIRYLASLSDVPRALVMATHSLLHEWLIALAALL